ncbi:crotonase/enoyl-CoA hydratase family protein [Mycobacterium sp.]|uniref:crotonase/enoyl-CoA hydratase family protein n=1 Tax=Mycobacterium sp. TaxID=1785 RepID=UPI002F001090
MGERVHFSVDESVATIAMDDGKVNALSPDMQLEINEALDHAELEGVGAVVISGNNRVFSGGFDLKVLTGGGDAAIEMLAGGFELAARILAYPKPVVMACTGHSIAMGSFLMLCGDHLIGAPSHRVQANEVSIGLTMPGPALAILRHRLTPAAFQRAVGLSAEFKGESAVAAGYLDELVEADMVRPRAHEVAKGFTSLDARAHKESKLRARARVLDEIRTTIAAEFRPPR